MLLSSNLLSQLTQRLAQALRLGIFAVHDGVFKQRVQPLDLLVQSSPCGIAMFNLPFTITFIMPLILRYDVEDSLVGGFGEPGLDVLALPAVDGGVVAHRDEAVLGGDAELQLVSR